MYRPPFKTMRIKCCKIGPLRCMCASSVAVHTVACQIQIYDLPAESHILPSLLPNIFSHANFDSRSPTLFYPPVNKHWTLYITHVSLSLPLYIYIHNYACVDYISRVYNFLPFSKCVRSTCLNGPLRYFLKMWTTCTKKSSITIINSCGSF